MEVVIMSYTHQHIREHWVPLALFLPFYALCATMQSILGENTQIRLFWALAVELDTCAHLLFFGASAFQGHCFGPFRRSRVGEMQSATLLHTIG